MECKDLMVGDLVYIVRGYDKHLTIEKVKGIIADEDNLYPVTIFTGETVSLNDIKPIPLTEEILVKNGFLKRSGKEYYLKDDIVIFVGSDSCEVCTLYGECTAYSYVEDGYTTIATINYVHQLQRLLRLARVQKEIEL